MNTKRSQRIQERKNTWVKFGEAASMNAIPMIQYLQMLPPGIDSGECLMLDLPPKLFVRKSASSVVEKKEEPRPNIYRPPNSSSTLVVDGANWKETTCCIKISNIPSYYPERDLRDEFSQLGLRRMKYIETIGVIYATFTSHSRALNAVTVIDKMQLDSMILSAELVPPPASK